MVLVVRIVSNIVNVHLEQSPLPGALKNARFKIWRKYFWQQGEHLELHGGILPLVSRLRHVSASSFRNAEKFSRIAL